MSACGTDRGYQRHRRLHEPPCEPCWEAHSQAMRDHHRRNPHVRAKAIRVQAAKRRAAADLAAMHPAAYAVLVETHLAALEAEEHDKNHPESGPASTDSPESRPPEGQGTPNPSQATQEPS